MQKYHKNTSYYNHRFSRLGKNYTNFSTNENPLGKKLAVIVNEFGDIGVDGEILRDVQFLIVQKKILWSWLMAAFAAP